MKESYLEVVSLIERSHRRYLEVVKSELDALKVYDINNVQALVLYNLGEDQISIGELITKGCYLGSNVSYNLKKMLENGYVEQIVPKHDKRSCVVKLSSKGMALYKKLDAIFDRHIVSLKEQGVDDMPELIQALRKLEQFWNNTAIQKVRFAPLRGK